MDKQTAAQIHREINEAMKAIAEKHNLSVPRGVGTQYSLESNTIAIKKFEMTGSTDGGLVETREFRNLQAFYPDLVNKEFTYQGRKAILIGYNTRAPKRPAQFRFVDEGMTGKFWVTGAHLFDTARAA